MSDAVFTILDNTDEQTHLKLPMPAGEFNALPGAPTTWDDLRSAIEGVIIGTLGQSVLAVDQEVGVQSGIPVTDPFAVHEAYWEITYVDAELNVHTMRITCPEQDLVIDGTEDIDMVSTEFVTFESAFEAAVAGKNDTSVTIQSMKLKGRDQ